MHLSDFSFQQAPSTYFVHEPPVSEPLLHEPYSSTADPATFDEVTPNRMTGDRAQHTSSSEDYPPSTVPTGQFPCYDQHQFDVPITQVPDTLTPLQALENSGEGPSCVDRNDYHIHYNSQVPLAWSGEYGDFTLDVSTGEYATYSQDQVFARQDPLPVSVYPIEEASFSSIPRSFYPRQGGVSNTNALIDLRWRDPLTGPERHLRTCETVRRDRQEMANRSFPSSENHIMPTSPHSGVDNALVLAPDNIVPSSQKCALGCGALIKNARDYPNHAQKDHEIPTGHQGKVAKICPWTGCGKSVKGVWKHLSVHFEPFVGRKCSACPMVFSGMRSEKVLQHYKAKHPKTPKPQKYEFVFRQVALP
ncbi:hypothetical protein GALMADRAFT_281670 [Galerina marginata CBS 339.88]|uniref:Uncharacterized protein n=1 Tax=Galerina marginata (strain CBS 339.88) TaxID=685588 RepID=A0A067SVW2_GALM3|nr:hypothetical protein GALMADRAFT_281670 [Galerina marginata CBS 339.88]